MSSSNAVFNGHRRVPPPVNEPIRSYAPGSPERASLKARLKAMAAETVDMPLIIGGKDIRTGDTATSVMPHDHAHVLGEYHKATEQHVAAGDRSGAAAHARVVAPGRSTIAPPCILKAAELLTTTWRDTINAATMLGQSKTAFQAEIDSAVRDHRLLALQRALRPGAARRAADRAITRCGTSSNTAALEGFVYAVTPFNFTSIAAQPADRAGADGQHGRLEAGVERDVLGRTT